MEHSPRDPVLGVGSSVPVPCVPSYVLCPMSYVLSLNAAPSPRVLLSMDAMTAS